MRGKNIYGIIYLILYIIIIAYITLLVRSNELHRIIRLTPFWMDGYWNKNPIGCIFHSLLNTILFLPLGYYLSALFRVRWVIIITAFATIMTELLQYFTFLGMLDVNDIVFNIIGGIIGLGVYMAIEKHFTESRIIVMHR
ncbi:MAG: VanZ family protein [Lachnospiraceae bacterium]|nr:VanZ family protein [Lachnospiraceae bacterium]